MHLSTKQINTLFIDKKWQPQSLNIFRVHEELQNLPKKCKKKPQKYEVGN